MSTVLMGQGESYPEHTGLLSYQDVARKMGVSPRTVWDWCNTTRILPLVKIGRKRYIRAIDLMAMINRSVVGGDGQGA